MNPEIIEKSEMILGGIAASSENVSELDIGGLWERFIEQSDKIPYQVDKEIGYELHIEEDRSPKMHFCLIGVEVSQVASTPIETFYKAIPQGTYVLYEHHFNEGGYSQAFKAVYDWLENSDYEPAYAFDIQCYDARFKGPDDPDSIMEILVPVVLKEDS